MAELYDNIQLEYGNFCIGPVAGTFCTVNISADPVVMSVKNTSGDLIRNYEFTPNGVLGVPGTEYPIKTVIDLEYVGPNNQSSFYTGAIFYTFERVLQGEYQYKVGDSYTSIAYSDRFIIRKWLLNESNFTLELKNTWTRVSDSTNYFDCYTFAVENFETTLASSTTSNTGVIELTTVSGLNKYDTLLIGPSSDTDNVGKVEEVYVHDIIGNNVYIRTYENYTPTIYEYVIGDSVTMVKDFFVCSDPEPLVVDGRVDEFKHDYGYMYKLSQIDYANVLLKSTSAMFKDVTASCWNSYYNAYTFIKGSNLLSINLSTLEVFKSQKIENIENLNNLFPIFDLQIEDSDIYLLQDRVYKRDDSGDDVVVNWSTYNYQIDSLVPYISSIDITASPVSILTKDDLIDLTVIVRDQFGVGVINKTVNLYKTGDSGAEFTPSDGVGVTDSNGVCTISYRSGSNYKGSSLISARVNGGNTSHGSVYVWNEVYLYTYNEFTTEPRVITQYDNTDVICTNYIPQIESLEEEIYIPCFSDFSFPGGHTQVNRPYTELNLRNQFTSIAGGYVIRQEFSEDGNVLVPQIKGEGEVKVVSKEVPLGEYPVTQLTSSRRLNDLNLVSSTLDQFAFIQDSRPVFWSEKNPVDTDYWIRLRPFAFSLDITTLKIKFKEVNKALNYNSGWYTVNNLGEITTFDAGSGLFGIDFIYQPDLVFKNNSILYVSIEVYDLAPIPNVIFVDYWFKIIADYKAPYIYDQHPSIEQYNVEVDTDISFKLADTGSGVNITSVELFINNSKVSFSYIKHTDNLYTINYTPPSNFYFGETVNIYVRADDNSSSDNLLIDSWRFFTIDSSIPWFNNSNYIPKPCSKGVSRDRKDISFQVYGVDGAGIDSSSIMVHVGGKMREVKITPIIYRLR